MTHEEHPSPLKEQAELPNELRRALSALGRQDEGSERLSRVAGRLGPLLDAPPPSSWSSRLLRFGVRQLTATRLVVVLLGLSGALWLRAAGDQATGHGAQPAVTQRGQGAQASTPAQREALSAPLQGAPAKAGVEPPTSEEQRTSEEQPSAIHHAPSSAKRSGARVRRRVVQEPPSAVAERPPELPGHQAIESVPAPAPVQEAPGARLQTRNAQVIAEGAAPQKPGRSESELLFDARKLMAKQPRKALELLEQHALRYPRGLLAPERELLAIQALRELGLPQVAEQRARQFRQQYPNSIHLGQAGASK